MLTQDQQDLLDFLAQRVDDLAGKARAAAAGKARALINEAEELASARETSALTIAVNLDSRIVNGSGER